jgi:cephalosporin-C deacetylase
MSEQKPLDLFFGQFNSYSKIPRYFLFRDGGARFYSPFFMHNPVPGLEHSFPFDPTYGYSLEKLLAVPAPDGPADFEEFWRSTRTEAMDAPLGLEAREVPSPHPGHALFEVEFDSLGGVRIGAWITVPRKGPRHGGWVVYHGYGGRGGPDFDLPAPAGPAIFPCARGFNRSASRDIPGEAMRHVVHGIKTRETYVHRGCVADVWRAASALLTLHPEVAEDLRYYGGSFGGGMGALAVPWEDRFRTAFLDIPSFGNHPLRVTLPCTGSGASVRRHWRRHPEVLDVLAYFDAATAAQYITIPAFVAAATFDPAVPPPGQFAIYNAIPEPKELFVRTAAHFTSPYEVPEGKKLHRRLSSWFTSPVAR